MSLPALVERLERMSEQERRVISRLVHRERVARNVNEIFAARQTLGQRVADRIAEFGGSWVFIFLFLAVLGMWIAFNAESPQRFDPYPFILLNLALSCIAALQAPVILMSQNRQTARDRVNAEHDYEVNLKAELEIMQLHVKLDDLRTEQWSALMKAQAEQLQMLEQIVKRVTAN